MTPLEEIKNFERIRQSILDQDKISMSLYDYQIIMKLAEKTVNRFPFSVGDWTGNTGKTSIHHVRHITEIQNDTVSFVEYINSYSVPQEEQLSVNKYLEDDEDFASAYKVLFTVLGLSAGDLLVLGDTEFILGRPGDEPLGKIQIGQGFTSSHLLKNVFEIKKSPQKTIEYEK